MDTWFELAAPEDTPSRPPAMEAALFRGDVQAAAKAYERLRPEQAAAWREQQKPLGKDRIRLAGLVCAAARDFAAAAQLLEAGGEFAQAAAMYEQGGRFGEAAACHHRVGDLAQAGATYERAGRVEKALLFYQQARAWGAMAACLARHERFFEAAAVYQKMGNTHAEVGMLRRVLPPSPHWLAATKRLAALMEHHGHDVPAVQMLTQAARESEVARKDPELLELTARLLEKQGRADSAAKVRAALAALTPKDDPDEDIELLTPAPAPLQTDVIELNEAVGETESALQEMQTLAYDQLKEMPVFSSVSLEDLRDLHRVAREIHFAPGEILLAQSAPGAGLYVIIDGKADVIVKTERGETKLNGLHPGDTVGELSLVSAGDASARVVATTPIHALLVERGDFQAFLFNHPEAAHGIYREFAKSLAERVRALSAAL